MIDKTFIASLKSKLDLREIAAANVDTFPAGKRVKALCPFHHDNDPSLYIDSQGFKCFGCNKKGDIINWFEEFYKEGFPEAVRRAADLAGVPVDEELVARIATATKERDRLNAEIGQFVTELWSPSGEEALSYLLEHRNLTEETVVEFMLGYDKNKKAIAIPLLDNGNNVVAYSRRVLSAEGAGKSKYWQYNTAFFQKALYLYNSASLRDEEGPIYVAEGYFDVMSIVQAGYRRTVGICGGLLNEAQITILRQNGDDIILVPDVGSDNDWSLFRENSISLRKLHPDCRLKAVIPTEKDANETPPDELSVLLGSPIPAEKALLHIVVVGDRTQQYDRAREFLAQVKDPLVREDIIRDLSGMWDRPRNLIEQSMLAKASDKHISSLTVGEALRNLRLEEQESLNRDIQLLWPGLGPYLNRIRRKHLIGVMARTSVGKTMFMLNMLKNTHGEVMQLVFSLEQPTTELSYRMAVMNSYELNYPMTAEELDEMLKNSCPTEEEKETWDLYTRLMDERYPLVRFFDGVYSAEEIEAIVADTASRSDIPIGVIWIDYLGLMKGGGRDEYERVSSNILKLQELAKKFNVLVVFLHQINRTGGTGHEPVSLDMARGSGVVEEAIDLFIGLYRPSEDDLDDRQEIVASVLKNRHGRKGDKNLIFCTESFRIHLPEFWMVDDDGGWAAQRTGDVSLGIEDMV
jgi:DnaB-like helicase C terminal domain/CHC2 zinc finger/Toprim domain